MEVGTTQNALSGSLYILHRFESFTCDWVYKSFRRLLGCFGGICGRMLVLCAETCICHVMACSV